MLSRQDWLSTVEQAAHAGGVTAILVLRLRDLDALRLEFGYDTVDALLEATERVVHSVLRPEDRYCRLGEAVYALLLPQLRSESHAALAANRLSRAFAGEIAIDGRLIHVAIAIGMSFIGDVESTAHSWLRQADIACTEALQLPHALLRFEAARYTSEVNKEQLREALMRNQLEIWLQPICQLPGLQIAGAEALARWRQGERGWISPSQFVPSAERVGLISDFTRWSLNTTLRHAAAARQFASDLKISFNLSPRIFVEPDLVEQVLSALRLWNVPPTALKVEVTEGAIMHDPERSAQILTRFHDEGVGIAIDDFGTGYSSFTYLRQFPATELKIDQSFVRELTRDQRSRQLVRSMIDLAHNLELRVVAEGAEDQATLDVLAEFECDLVQGFFVGRPAPADDFVDALGKLYGAPSP